MTFKMGANGGNCSFCAWIVAEGEIDENTPEDFLKFYEKNPYDYTVVFNSEGGNLIAGLELGRIIRAKNLSTEVAKTYNLEGDASHLEEKSEGICYSACAYAFLGGVDREVTAGEIGFHQFYSASGKSEATMKLEKEGFSTDQLLSGIISEYLSDMGVSGQILGFASTQDKNSLYFPSEQELIAYDIVTGYGYEGWSLAPSGEGLVASALNKNKKHIVRRISTFCTQSPESYAFVFHTSTKVNDAQFQTIKDSLNGGNVNIKGFSKERKIFIPRELLHAEVYGGYISIFVAMSSEVKDAIQNASDISIEIDAPMSSFRPSLIYSPHDLQETLKTWKLAWKNCLV